MENSKAILLLLTLGLAGTSILLFILYSSAHAQVTEAESLGLVVRDFLTAQRTPCNAAADQYARLAGCVSPLLMAKDFKEDAFKQPDDRTDAAGYLVIRNVNNRAYDAEKFAFTYNRAPISDGCKDLEGTVDKEVTCRFDFLQTCEKGTVLEVTYPVKGEDGNERPVRVFLKTC